MQPSTWAALFAIVITIIIMILMIRRYFSVNERQLPESKENKAYNEAQNQESEQTDYSVDEGKVSNAKDANKSDTETTPTPDNIPKNNSG